MPTSAKFQIHMTISPPAQLAIFEATQDKRMSIKTKDESIEAVMAEALRRLRLAKVFDNGGTVAFVIEPLAELDG
jgi:hypothetical protein